ncbi:hypothetical protein HDF18_13735 [Mucilaginibacter sp. X5P1]|nr:hypothetical protein [Mucilaginibacter sp. X5P1]MBB6138659.1 hypothetical protein [Mucilaginibacter sp. X5P1]
MIPADEKSAKGPSPIKKEIVIKINIVIRLWIYGTLLFSLNEN